MKRAWAVLALRQGAATVVAMVVTVAGAWLVDPEPALAVFGALLAISLSRSQLDRTFRERAEAAVALPVIAVAGAGVGALLAALPWVGAAVFTLVLTASVALRQYGATARRLGALMALPFTVLLVAPVRSARLGPVEVLVASVGVGLLAWAAVTAVQLAGRRVGVLPPAARREVASASARTGRRLRATDRLAAQMFLALGAAFGVGFVFFPDRWAWVVLSALVVTLGNAGRADVTHKAVHRVVGAGLGSVIAVLVAVGVPSAAGVIFIGAAALIVGIMLRPFGYGWWAMSITVALAIVQSFAAGGFSLLQRWEEILIGAGLAVLVAWVVLPLRSSDIVRLRIGAVLAQLAASLAALDAASDSAAPRRSASDSGASGTDSGTSGSGAAGAVASGAVAALERAAGPFDAVRWLPARWRPRACGWIESTRQAVPAVAARPEPGTRAALADARRAVRDPDALGDALDRLVVVARG